MTLDVGKTEEQTHYSIKQEFKIYAEYQMVAAEKISGVYVIPSYQNSLLWYGVIFVRSGCFAGGIFRFTILLPENFPADSALPIVVFQSDVFHPLICPSTKTLDITSGFNLWRRGEDHIWQVLNFLQHVFVDPWKAAKLCSSASNQEAMDLITDREKFISRAKVCVEESQERVYEQPEVDDPHYITFEKFDINIHGATIEKIRTKAFIADTSSSPSNGLSWVKEGEFKSLSVE